MAIARRAQSPTPVERMPLPALPAEAGLPHAVLHQEEEAHLDGRLRRCTFRRLDPVRRSGRGPAAYYLVTCLYGGPEAALPLGDLAAAQPVCGACQAPGIFRPDEN